MASATTATLNKDNNMLKSYQRIRLWDPINGASTNGEFSGSEVRVFVALRG